MSGNCRRKNMVVYSTFYSHKEVHKQIWRSPHGKTNNQSYCVLIDKRNASSTIDVKLCTGAKNDKNHLWLKERIDDK